MRKQRCHCKQADQSGHCRDYAEGLGIAGAGGVVGYIFTRINIAIANLTLRCCLFPHLIRSLTDDSQTIVTFFNPRNRLYTGTSPLDPSLVHLS